MRRIYIYQAEDWPNFQWDKERLLPLLSEIRHKQGRLLGRMEGLGFGLQSEATLQTLTLDVLKTSEIEGEHLDKDQVRSSIARRLGIDIGGMVPSDRNVDGVVEMMLDATRRYNDPLEKDRLFSWHSSLFPSGRSGMHRIVSGAWRDNLPNDPMQVVSGAIGKEIVHFEAPVSTDFEKEMSRFITWFNQPSATDPVLKAAIAHLWFVTIHPFDDGNGRIARAITDMELCRSDASAQRFYSMSAQVRKERSAYYNILEKTQKGTLDITAWLVWFLECLDRSFNASYEILNMVLKKAGFWDRHAKTILNNRQVILINKMLDGFEGKLNSSKWAKIAKCSTDTALRDINDLVEKKVLMKESAGGRSTSYELI